MLLFPFYSNGQQLASIGETLTPGATERIANFSNFIFLTHHFIDGTSFANMTNINKTIVWWDTVFIMPYIWIAFFGFLGVSISIFNKGI